MCELWVCIARRSQLNGFKIWNDHFYWGLGFSWISFKPGHSTKWGLTKSCVLYYNPIKDEVLL